MVMRAFMLRLFLLICICGYLLVRIDRLTHWFVFPDIIHYYLNDLLCLPILLTLTLYVIRFVKRDSTLKFSCLLIFGNALFYSILFEGLLPQISKTYTADFIDILMYWLGGGLFWMVQKLELQFKNV